MRPISQTSPSLYPSSSHNALRYLAIYRQSDLVFGKDDQKNLAPMIMDTSTTTDSAK